MHRSLMRMPIVWGDTGAHQCPIPNCKGQRDVGSYQGSQGAQGAGNWFLFLQDYHHNAGRQMLFRSCMALPTPVHLTIFYKLLTPFLKTKPTKTATWALWCLCLGRWLLLSKYRAIHFFLLNYILICLRSFSKLSWVFWVLILYLHFLLTRYHLQI